MSMADPFDIAVIGNTVYFGVKPSDCKDWLERARQMGCELYIDDQGVPHYIAPRPLTLEQMASVPTGIAVWSNEPLEEPKQETWRDREPLL